MAFWGPKELSSQTQIHAIPCRLQLPTNKWRSAGPGRSLYLLSINGLAALGGQSHSLSGTEFSASKWDACLLPATQAESHAGSKVYIWNVFGLNNQRDGIGWPESRPGSIIDLRDDIWLSTIMLFQSQAARHAFAAPSQYIKLTPPPPPTPTRITKLGKTPIGVGPLACGFCLCKLW